VIRVALYWTPPRDDALSAAGHAWLGRDAELGAVVAQPAVPGIEAATRAAGLYGFHATLRPPMRLATGWAEFMRAAETLAAATAPFALPPLAVGDIGGFLALRETAPCPALHALADGCVLATDPHRLRADAAELARRRAPGLSAEEDALLVRWGYPHVLSRWRFHMTLTSRLDAGGMAVLRPAAEAHFAASAAAARTVREIAVFTQAAPGAPFRVAERLALGGEAG
jgi:hypothetical protein